MVTKYDSLTSGEYNLSSSSSSSSPSSKYPALPQQNGGNQTTERTEASQKLEMTTGETEPLVRKTKHQIPGFIHVRHQLGIAVFIGMTAVCSMRQNVSVAMVAMVNDSFIASEYTANDSDSLNTCRETSINSTSYIDDRGEFFWSAHTQELLLAGFFYGYIFTQAPGGWLSDKYGMKWILGFGILLSSICTLLGPSAAYASTEWYFVTRFISGLGEGFTFPALLSMWSKWAHPSERSRLSVIGFAGVNFGNVVGNSLAGAMNSLDILGGWPFTFYVFGSFGCLWFVIWCFVAYSTPEEHPWISIEEREYLQEGLQHKTGKTRVAVPWLPIVASPAMWVLVVCQFINAWGIFTLLTNLPLYFSDGLGVTIAQAGLYSAIPYGMQLVIMVICSHISDRMQARDVLSRVTTRKLMTALGFFFTALFLALAGFARCNIAQSVTFVTLAMGLDGIAFSGYFVALLDISGPYAGSAMGMMNIAGTLGGIVGPYIVGTLTENQADIFGWQKVMWIIAGLYLFGTVFYTIFGTVKQQRWAIQKQELNQSDYVNNIHAD